jgi:superfamily II DNA or RNA helicase
MYFSLTEFYLITPYHAQYFAHDLTRQGGKGLDRLAQSLVNASVDLNPHQVEAALFALRSPLSQGVLLADEVGLGKTIEAGLVLCQKWAERKRKLLVICPASLRKQWQVELEEKFFLPSTVIDQTTFNRSQKEGNANPFEVEQVMVVSYHYAANKAQELRAVGWDLVVLDEAHRLRNSHRESNVVGQALRWALEGRRKLLLTATPLQNNTSEIYGLASFIDDKLFGDFPTFRTLYCGADADLAGLRDRLSHFAIRTLRRNVLEFIRYTKRHLITVQFRPDDEEQKLYSAVSEFLQRPETYAIPSAQRHLLSIVVRKVLASSSHAVAGTLDVIADRLRAMKANLPETDITTRILESEEMDTELLEDLLAEMESPEQPDSALAEPPPIDPIRLAAELAEVEQFARWARAIGIDTKTRKLIEALNVGWKEMQKQGAEPKAVVFTESRRTQEYLRNFLEANGYAGQVICFSGGGKDPQVQAVYQDWIAANPDKATGSRAADIRQAVVHAFRTSRKILLATEAAAEGFNLQFCSLLVNFDLPWNPQRIEQRIGRIHRYGQKHDVVVINFLNERNSADQRVYELLKSKFHLFEGVFGASDGILGQTESGAGLEKKILAIYQNCRTEEEIAKAFDELRHELEAQITQKMDETREKILGHFDEDVHSRLRIQHEEAVRALGQMERKFWRLTRFTLDGHADFDEAELAFDLKNSPATEVPTGWYSLLRKRGQAEAIPGQSYRPYHLSHPMAQWCLQKAKEPTLAVAELWFDVANYNAKLSALEPLRGRSGWLHLELLSMGGLEEESHLLFTAQDDSGRNIDPELVEQIFRLDSEVMECQLPPLTIRERLQKDAHLYADSKLRESLEQNNVLFQEKRDQLYRWADDVVAAAERELSLAKAELRAAEKAAGIATTAQAQLEAQNRIRELESKKRQSRRRIDDVEDSVFAKRNGLIQELEQRVAQTHSVKPLFTIRWRLV